MTIEDDRLPRGVTLLGSVAGRGFHVTRMRHDIARTDVRHQHPHAQIIIVLDGAWTDDSHGDVRILHYGDLLFYPAEVVHTHTAAADTEVILIDLTPALISEVAALYGNRARTLQFSFDALEGLPERIATEIHRNDPLTPHIVDCLLRLMLALGARAVEQSAAATPWLSRALSYVEAHLAEPISVTDLAAIACVSESKFTRAFRDFTGNSPAAYIRTRRLCVAARLLRQTQLSIHEVAASTGFYDQAHFSRVFKASERLTPLEYRRSRRTKTVVDGPSRTAASHDAFRQDPAVAGP
jgi:AraC family transcriptional regulator